MAIIKVQCYSYTYISLHNVRLSNSTSGVTAHSAGSAAEKYPYYVPLYTKVLDFWISIVGH